MDRVDAVTLIERCESARKQSNKEQAQEVARKIWNQWAEDLLVEKQRLVNEGLWSILLEFVSGHDTGQNDEPNDLPQWLGLVSLGHTLLSSVLLFLLLPGVRNIFKIK